MPTTWLLSDDVTPASALTLGPTAAGDVSATTIVHLWNSQGTPGGSLANLSIQAVDPATDLDSGVDWLDQAWLEARINGGTNPSADPAFVAPTTDWFQLGNGMRLPAPDLPGDCAFYVELRLRPPMKDGTPTETGVNFKLITNYNESLFSLAGALAGLGSGIITGVGDRTVTEWVEAPAVTATGTPDAVVHVGRRWYVAGGLSLRTVAADALTLDQTDVAAAALSSGHEYRAVISQPVGNGSGDTAAVVTKGVLAVTGAGVLPAVPTGNLLIATVTVAYHASASVINQSDITTFAVDGRGKPSIGTGLNVNVAALRAVMPGARIVNRSARTVAVPASLTSWLWLSSADAFTVTQSAVPPFAGALPVAKVVTGVSTITTLTDLRTFFEPNARVVTLKSVYGFGEPRLFPKIATIRQDFAIANAAFTDLTLDISGDVLLLAVSGYWKVKPTGSTTADVGVAGTTQRYATATSTTAGQTFTGLKAGPIYSATAPVIRVTPNAISAADGVLELTATVLVIRNSATMRVGNVNLAYPWNIDRLIASVNPAGGDATGSTEFDVQVLPAGTSICPSGARPSIAALSTSDAGGYPNVTVGGPTSFGLFLSDVTHPGTDNAPEDVQVDLIVYPLTQAA
jgi:hypothetical protein